MKTTIEMAREAGFFVEKAEVYSPSTQEDHELTPYLERFAEFVRAEERDALKQINWTAIMREGGLVTWGDAGELADRVVAVIQARKQA